MTLAYQHRAVPVSQFRATPDGVPGRFEATVLRYNTVDDYRTIFLPDCFNASMDLRMPRVVWSHDWSEPLGRYISYETNDEILRLVGEFDDFNEVPRARQGYAQLKSGTIDQFSVGFMPEVMTTVDVPLGESGEQSEKVDAFVEGRLDEVSLVLVGAVPGTELLNVRFGQHPGRPRIIVARQNVVDVDLAAGVLLDLQTGKVDLADALMTLKTGARPAADESPDKPEGEEAPEVPEGEELPGADNTETPDEEQDEPEVAEAEAAAVEAEIAEALAILEGVN